MADIPAVKYGGAAIQAVQNAVAAAQTVINTPLPVDNTGYKPSKLSPGKFVGEMWVQDDGYQVDKKWVGMYPDMFGPLRKDPDGGMGELESDDIIARISAKFTGYGGTFSTWNERHAFLIFAGIGFNKVESSADVPPIPDMFLGEAAYCYAGMSMGRAAKKLDDAGGLKKVISLILAGGLLGNLPRFWDLIMSGALF